VDLTDKEDALMGLSKEIVSMCENFSFERGDTCPV
jgi:hypothetical protein